MSDSNILPVREKQRGFNEKGGKNRGNQLHRYEQGRGVRKEKNARALWVHVNLHSCTHTALLHLHRVQTEEKTKKRMTERKTPCLSVRRCVCLRLATQEKQKSRSGGG